MDKTIKVIGAGLAGCEAAWQIAKRGIKVKLYEMKAHKKTPAHKLDTFAELVCSNSLRSNQIENAVGLLKEELRLLDSLLIECADKTCVPAGGALAVDRDLFSQLVTSKIRENENIEIMNKEVECVDLDEYTVIASGPLTSDTLSENIQKVIGHDYLHFFDASAPIVTYDSIDMNKAFKAARYDKGDDDYINCPMNKQEYEKFYEELINAQEVEFREFEKGMVFEGCMPVEIMAKRGVDTLRYGPLKPVGLKNPRNQEEYYAVVQLRQDNKEGSLFNMVGFQTHLKWSEQKRVFSLIPGLENAEFLRYGVMHKNTFINSPKLLDETFNFTKHPKIYFAGQITGVEGYVESIASGFVAGLNITRSILGDERISFPKNTAIGGLSNYIADDSVKNFQPMNVNFGLLNNLKVRIRSKKEKYGMLAKISLEQINRFKDSIK